VITIPTHLETLRVTFLDKPLVASLVGRGVDMKAVKGMWRVAAPTPSPPANLKMPPPINPKVAAEQPARPFPDTTADLTIGPPLPKG